MAAEGRLTQKISRQSISVSAPPTRGPAAAATEPPTAHSPIARVRAVASVKPSRISANDGGVISAAPAPCRIRPATSQPRLGASPHAAEAVANTSMPSAYARPAPIRSDRVPANRINAENVRV